jgi:23S rRNA (uridine2552-2'-O)-methyltransferase
MVTRNRIGRTLMAQNKRGKNWVKEHDQDPWVQRARKEGWRARSCFKLMEMADKDGLLRPGQRVLDLGAAPGGWSQVAAARVGERGRVIASDILDMEPVPGVSFLQGDFREEDVYQRLLGELDDGRVDLVLSDMSPNISGHAAIDQPRVMGLAELALDMARTVLAPEGQCLIKVFQGEGFDEFRQAMKASFRTVKSRKPEASRARSPEVYLLGSGREMV